MIRAIIVDDEPLAREKVLLFARSENDIEIVDVCANGHDALSSCKKFKPDLLFLDIQMPEMNGFEMLNQLKIDPLPGIIFITAYDEFALRAFEFHAVDYLLKPFDRNRFTKAVNHARESIQSHTQSDETALQIQTMLNSINQESARPERLIVKTNGKIIFLRMNEIDWMEAAGNYVNVHVGNEAHLIRETMNNIQDQLDPQHFIRIHRGTIINIEKVKELQPYYNGEYKVVLQNNTQVILSRGYRENFKKILGKPL
ncbi:MAG: LytTR family DNA-binding domain-containing protein [Bacteroidota bacterium]